MIPISRACAKSYYVSIVGLNVCLSCSVTDVFSVEYWRDLKLCIRGYSRSLEMVPFESLDTVSYSHSTTRIANTLAVSTQYTNVTDRHVTTA